MTSSLTEWAQLLKKSALSSPLAEKAILSFELVRSLTFTAQNISLLFIEMLATGSNQRFNKEFAPRFRQIYSDIYLLLKKDAENIAKGVYPIEVLKTESPADFLRRYPRLVRESFQVSRRRLDRRHTEFNQEAQEYMRDVPDYFQRNFHYQSDGYLTDKSAEFYDHQVEILFGGVGDAMRRLIIPMMKNHFPYSQGEGLHFLEVAAGTGRMTRFIKLAFPKAKISLLDLSHPYLKKAQENLSEFKKIDFIQGDSAELPFKDQQFDAVYSCFLFHELPMDVRKQTLREGLRVLKPGGFYGLVDSIQQFDKAHFDWALGQFPIDFHEPFYKNYTQNPMEGLLQAAGFENIQKDIGFFSKAIAATKSVDEPLATS